MEKSKALSLTNVRKVFGDCVAADNISFSVQGGTIHAVVGENGAGKSTAMKILYGQYYPDQGQILVNGLERHWRSPADAIAAGIGMVHQHFMLAEPHNALDNILLGTHRAPYVRMGRSAAAARLRSIMNEFGLEVPLNVPVGDLPVGLQQRIEILKLLYRDSHILILDEPTAVLTPGEIVSLFRILRIMAEKGKTILIITHKLKEVMDLAVNVSVFRAGRVVAERKVADTNLHELASLMVGRELKNERKARPASSHRVTVEARNFGPREAGSRLEEVSFRIRAGEILGIAGVEGNGQSELLRLLMNPKAARGHLLLEGRDVSALNATAMRAQGLAVFPEDRLKEALLLDANLEENFLLGFQRKFLKGGFFLDGARARAAVTKAIAQYDVRPANPEAIAGSLSGGNQQKLVVARELQAHPKFLLSAQPTRGVDIGAVEFIHGKLLEVRNAGAAVLLVSSELEEVLSLSDRLLVMYRGRVVGSFAREDFDEQKIGGLMAGGAQ